MMMDWQPSIFRSMAGYPWLPCPICAQEGYANAIESCDHTVRERAQASHPGLVIPPPSTRTQSLTRGTYVIMNDVDCPEAFLVAVLTRYDGAKGIWHALYLSERTNMAAPYGSRPTPLSDFGMTIEWKWHEYRAISNGKPCVATYRDGKPRQWQDRHGEDRWWKARKKAVKACETFAAEAVSCASAPPTSTKET